MPAKDSAASESEVVHRGQIEGGGERVIGSSQQAQYKKPTVKV